MTGCMHPEFISSVNVHRVNSDELKAFVACINIRCATCGVPMQVIGAIESDISFEQITTDESHLDLHVPLKPFGGVNISAQQHGVQARLN